LGRIKWQRRLASGLKKNSGETPLPLWNNSATGGPTIAIQPAWREPSRAELFYCSWDQFVTSPKKTKTYGRFLGTIFFGGAKYALAPDFQWLARQEILQKPEKLKIK
jgi:hypothetical protein